MREQNHSIYEFGPFRLDGRKRLLYRDNQIVPLKPKAFDTLLALVERSGQVMDEVEVRQRTRVTIEEEEEVDRAFAEIKRKQELDLQSFSWLEKGFQKREGLLPTIRWFPAFIPLRSGPRLKELIRRINLPGVNLEKG